MFLLKILKLENKAKLDRLITFVHCSTGRQFSQYFTVSSLETRLATYGLQKIYTLEGCFNKTANPYRNIVVKPQQIRIESLSTTQS